MLDTRTIKVLIAAVLACSLGLLQRAAAQSCNIQCGDRVGVTYAGDNANVRSAPCGSVVTQIRAGNEGQVASSSCWQDCSLGGTIYRFWRVLPHGWIAQGTGSTCWLVPMPGEGYYPNVTANLGAYPVRVYGDVGSAGLLVRLGPGRDYPEVASRRSVGATGIAYTVRVRDGLVWWRIRWSNGDIGWSADSQIPYGVYLTKTGSPSGYTVVQLRLEASGSGGSVGIEVRTPDLDATIPSNFIVNTPINLRYVAGDTVRLIAPATAPNGAPFQRWLRNGSSYSTNRDITFTINSNDTLTAVYATPTNTITIQSSNPNSGVSITVSPADNNGQSNGTTPFSRTYNQGTSVTLTAPATAPNGNTFQEWRRNGVFFSTSRTITFTVNANDTFTAVYQLSDTQPPSISNCRVSPTTLCIGNNTITISANVTDDQSGVDAVWAEVCDSTRRVNLSPSSPGSSFYTGTYSFSSCSPINNCVVTIYARDRAGNQSSCRVSERVNVLTCLDVQPTTGATFSITNGRLNPTSVSYTLRNTSNIPIAWSASADQNWITITPSSGNLGSGRQTVVNISINNDNANSLPNGTYNAIVSFHINTCANFATRNITLIISGRNHGGAGNTQNTVYWGAKVKLLDSQGRLVASGNLVALSGGKIYLGKIYPPDGGSRDTIRVGPDSSVTFSSDAVYNLSTISKIEIVNPSSYTDVRGQNGYGGINKYLARIGGTWWVVELGDIPGCGNCGRRSFNALSHGTAYENRQWKYQRVKWQGRFVCEPHSVTVDELIAIPLVNIDVNSDINDNIKLNIINNKAFTYKIPPHILYAIAANENRWLQSGYEYATTPCVDSSIQCWYNVRMNQLTPDGGIGMMQITGGTVFDSLAMCVDINGKLSHVLRLCRDAAYNIEAGARVLDAKSWRGRIGPGLNNEASRAVIEHWYYAVWAYRGWTYLADRSPVCGGTTPCGGQSLIYPQVIWALMRGGNTCQLYRPTSSSCSERWTLRWDPIQVTDAPPGNINWYVCADQPSPCSLPTTTRNIPTPLPAHVDIDFDGNIDFKIEGSSNYRCTYGQLSMVCNNNRICGKVTKVGTGTLPLPNSCQVIIGSYTLQGNISPSGDGTYVTFSVPISGVSGIAQITLKWINTGDRRVDGKTIVIHHDVPPGNLGLMVRSIRGRVELQDYVGEMPSIVSFVLRDVASGEVVAEHDAYLGIEDGSFEIPAPAGVYELSVKYRHWLRRAVIVDTTAGDASGIVLSLPNGDANEDNMVGDPDLILVLENWGAFCDEEDCPEVGLPGDLNGDRVVDDNDLLIVLFRYGEQGD